MATSTVVPHSVRRMPDPLFADAQRYVFVMRADEVPRDLPLDPNPRAQKIDRRVYRDVYDSLMNEGCTQNTFHLKNQGLTLLASDVKKIRSHPDAFRISFTKGQGIVDGGHSYQIILRGQESGEMPADQYVKLEVLVGVPDDMNLEIAEGLNTGMQVQPMSLAHLAKQFDGIRRALSGRPYESLIGYRENEPDTKYDARDIVAYMAVLNVELFPNDGEKYPVNAYRHKAGVLDLFLADTPAFEKQYEMLPEILALADTISYEARDLHNEAGGRAVRLSFVDQRKRGEYEFPFIERSSQYRLTAGALFPMLGAFRWMVQRRDDGTFGWKGSFEDTLALWRESGAELMRATQLTSEELGRKATSIGKQENHWRTLHSIVIRRQLVGSNSS